MPRRVGEPEHPVELRLEFAGPRAGVREHGLEPPERSLVAFEELDLELAKAPCHPLAVEDRDRVVHDLCTVRAHTPPPCPQPRNPHELLPAQESDEQGEEALGRAGRRPRLLQLDSRLPAWELELPEATPTLQPVAQRHSVARELQAVRVVIRGDEGAVG